MYSYKTIATSSSGLFTEKRSKFISLAIPIESEAEASTHIETIRKEYYDARHVCWAYVCGKRERIERLNDDGEPSSTAGKPILGQIHSRELTNVLVVVVRYFGGVKLGTGGLIKAYKAAAESALDLVDIVEYELLRRYVLTFDFEYINPVMMLLRNYNTTTISHDTDLKGYIWTVEIGEKDVQRFEEEANTLYKLKVKSVAIP